MAICHGPVSSVNRILIAKRDPDESGIVTNLPATSNITVRVNNVGLFGGDEKEGGIFGDLDIELGGAAQGQNAYLVSKFGAETPAFRGVTCAVFRAAPAQDSSPNYRSPSGGGYLTSITPYPKAWAFEVTDIPSDSFNPGKALINPSVVNGVTIGSANGAHIIYDSLINPDWGLGIPVNDIDLPSFVVASNALFTENFGMSLIFAQQTTIKDFLEQILTHINAVLYTDRQTGKFKLILIRDDYIGQESSLPLFDENNISALEFFERPAFAEMVNEIIIKYRKRGDLEDSSITAQDLASVQAQEGVISQTVEFPGIDSDDIAAKVAMRELKQSSTPLARVRFIANREAWQVEPGDVVRLSWGALGISQVILRITAVDYGTLENGLIGIDAIEDVFGLPSNSYIVPEDSGWSDEVVGPVPITNSRVVELPYFVIRTALPTEIVNALEDDDAFLQAVAEAPSNATFAVKLNTRTGVNAFEEVATGSVTPTAKLVSNLDRTTKSTIAIKNIISGSSPVIVGSYAYINSEVVKVEAVDFINGTINLGRGYLDSIPQSHNADDIIYFADGNDSIDLSVYTNADSVDARILSQTSLGTLDLALAPTLTLNMTGRQFKPYNGAQIRIGGTYFPASLTDQVSVIVTWTHQDRTQQLTIGGDDWYAVSLGSPELGTTYTVRYYNNTGNVLLFTDSGLVGTTSSYTPNISVSTTITMRVEVETERNGEVCLNIFSHIFNYTKPLAIRTLPNNDVRILPNNDRRILP